MSIYTEDFFVSLCDDIHAELSERTFNADMEKVEAALHVGSRLVKEIGERAAYGEGIVRAVAKVTGISKTSLYDYVLDARAQGDTPLQEFLEGLGIDGKGITIGKVTRAVKERMGLAPEKKEPCGGSCG